MIARIAARSAAVTDRLPSAVTAMAAAPTMRAATSVATRFWVRMAPTEVVLEPPPGVTDRVALADSMTAWMTARESADTVISPPAFSDETPLMMAWVVAGARSPKTEPAMMSKRLANRFWDSQPTVLTAIVAPTPMPLASTVDSTVA